MSARDRVIAAIRNEGPAPRLHRAVKARHRREWPTLWSALDALVLEDMPRPTIGSFQREVVRVETFVDHPELTWLEDDGKSFTSGLPGRYRIEEEAPREPDGVVIRRVYPLDDEARKALEQALAEVPADEEATDAESRLQSIADLHAEWAQGSMDVVTMATAIGRVIHS